MAGLTGILSLFYVAGAHLSSAPPVLRPAPPVQVGQNVSLACNLTSSLVITWYLLRSEQLLPLLTVKSSTVGVDTVDFHAADGRRVNNVGAVESGLVGLEILEVKEEDAGLYFCTGSCAGAVCVSRGVPLAVGGVDRDSTQQPCWSLGMCVLPALPLLCIAIVVGFYLCAGKPVCCCHSLTSSRGLKVTQDESLLYSSLKFADKPRPSGRGRTGLVEETATYSTVSNHKNPNGTHDRM